MCAAIYFWRSEDSCGVGFLVMWILRTEHRSPGVFGKGLTRWAISLSLRVFSRKPVGLPHSFICYLLLLMVVGLWSQAENLRSLDLFGKTVAGSALILPLWGSHRQCLEVDCWVSVFSCEFISHPDRPEAFEPQTWQLHPSVPALRLWNCRKEWEHWEPIILTCSISHPATLVGWRYNDDFSIFGTNKGYRKNGGLDYFVSIRCLHLF